MTIKEREEIEMRANILGRLQASIDCVSGAARMIGAHEQMGLLNADDLAPFHQALATATASLFRALQTCPRPTFQERCGPLRSVEPVVDAEMVASVAA